MAVARTLLLALLLVSPAGCDWLFSGQDNPHDQKRCSPSCAKGKVCFNGKCGPPDGAVPDSGREASVSDLKVTDGFTGPSCKTPCSNGKICDDNCWCWENPLSGRRQLNAIVGFQNFAIAVGEKGTVLRLDHNGWTASRISDKDLLAVWALGPTLIYAVGESGTVFRFENNKWYPVTDTAFGDKDLTGVWGTGVSDVHVVGEKGKAVHFDGKTWEALKDGTSTSVDFNGVRGRQGAGVYAVGDNCWISAWNGSKWQLVPGGDKPAGCSNNLNSVWVGGPGDVWVVGDNGTVLRSSKGNWSELTPKFTTQKLTHIWGQNVSQMWATTFDGKVFKYDGTTYKEVYNGVSDIITDKQLNGVWGSSATDVYAVGNVGKVAHYDGMRWRPVLPGITDVLHAVWVTPTGEVYAGGYRGRLLVRDKSGWQEVATHKQFNKSPSDDYASIFKVWGTSSSNIYAVGHQHLLHFDGKGWKDKAPPLAKAAAAYLADSTDHINWWGVWGSGPSDVWASGGSHKNRYVAKKNMKLLIKGVMAHYDGTSWTLQTPSGQDKCSNISSVWGSSASEVFASGLHGLVLRRAGGKWQIISDYNAKYWSWNFHGLWGTSPTNVFSAAKLGKVTSVTRMGAVFRYDGAALTKSLPDLKKAQLGSVWGTSPTDVYAVGQNFTIQRYDGAKWSAMATGAKGDDRGDLFSVGANKAGDVYAVGKYGTIYRRCGKN